MELASTGAEAPVVKPEEKKDEVPVTSAPGGTTEETSVTDAGSVPKESVEGSVANISIADGDAEAAVPGDDPAPDAAAMPSDDAATSTTMKSRDPSLPNLMNPMVPGVNPMVPEVSELRTPQESPTQVARRLGMIRGASLVNLDSMDEVYERQPEIVPDRDTSGGVDEDDTQKRTRSGVFTFINIDPAAVVQADLEGLGMTTHSPPSSLFHATEMDLLPIPDIRPSTPERTPEEVAEELAKAKVRLVYLYGFVSTSIL